ncbi:MAG: acyl-ACP desaturase [Acidimicrobiales bacterium]|nr:acyl-ACP desaturase [Acidimicrobiales bacterium]MDG2217066.1 acyl-ACP desaturase [Acidimicrobiales bacterium]
MATPVDAHLLEALASTGERLLERHLSTTVEWFPHTLIPWGNAEDYEADYEWEPDDVNLPAAVRSSLFVNVLTEDNLPYYFRDIERMFGRDGAWGEWVRRWTAEEGRHGIVLNGYLMATRSIDPVELERGRMAQVQSGETREPPTVAEGLAYVSLQELATRISHFNTGNMVTDPAGRAVMRRVAADENLHYLFYRDAMQAILDADPSHGVIAIWNQVRNFAMPGTGIPGFSAHAKAIADAGIYDLAIHHDKILQPVIVRDWKVEALEGLSGEAEEARTALMKHIARVGKIGARIASRRQEKAAQLEPANA